MFSSEINATRRALDEETHGGTDPAAAGATLAGILRAVDPGARVEPVPASLEDVFVAATSRPASAPEAA